MVDLHEDRGFGALEAELVSIAPDPPAAWSAEGTDYSIEDFTHVLTDHGNRVARRYGVMRWAAPTGEPGHTFVLVDTTGEILWVQDYGAPEHGGIMYVLPGEITRQVERRL